jgi:hypothetical protein
MVDSMTERLHANMLVFENYLKRRGLLEGAGLGLVAQVAQDVHKDQRAALETYSSCQQLCKPDDQSCKVGCAEKSEPDRQRCEQIVARFK